MRIREELERIKQKRRSVRPQELHRLLTRTGFKRRSGKGDHWIYTHPKRAYPLSIDPRNPLLPVYVSRAVRAIEEVLNGDRDENQDEA